MPSDSDRFRPKPAREEVVDAEIVAEVSEPLRPTVSASATVRRAIPVTAPASARVKSKPAPPPPAVKLRCPMCKQPKRALPTVVKVGLIQAPVCAECGKLARGAVQVMDALNKIFK